MKRLAGRKAWITGAGRGIGMATARAFAREGADLFLFDRALDGLEELAAQAREQGVKAAVRKGDVTDPGSVEAAAAAAEQALGGLNVLVNCAGIYAGMDFLRFTVDEWNRIFAVNVLGSALCAQAALKRMVPRKAGTVINLSSAAGRAGGKFRSAYSASKHAVIGLTRCLAVEFAEHGITCNAICPGMVDTEMFSSVVAGDAELLGAEREAMEARLSTRALQRRRLSPAEIADLAVYLASPEAKGMTGQALSLDAGMVMQ
jgi:NAD(P)-dependent dehydrogenase (short-subunit alcohol dehydrogenase family)